MKTSRLPLALLAAFLTFTPLAFSQTTAAPTDGSAPTEAQLKADAQLQKKAAEWSASLALNDAAKEARITTLIATHLTAVRDWHNAHPASTVPEGINPLTGKPLSKLEREIIADSAMPKSVNASLLDGLRAELTPEQVEAVLDKYTIGKVAFTMKAYKDIVPDLTPDEEAAILKNLKQAREESIGFKNMPQISAIFEIYKTKCEQLLNDNGRDWKKTYKAYTNRLKAEKAAAEATKKAAAAAAK